ncbi:hypothetical protein K438DRAFT_1796498 [Mycena galopus ATCC 62051]|nr:hypothetical protein K438DRAFT_1796498 [Mycena galopus ATCC 62051]
MEKGLHRVNLRRIKCVTFPSDSELGLALPWTWHVLALRVVCSKSVTACFSPTYSSLVVIPPLEKTPIPVHTAMSLIRRRLQLDIAPQIFVPRCMYDESKNIFSIHQLKFNTGSHESPSLRDRNQSQGVQDQAHPRCRNESRSLALFHREQGLA